MTNLDAARIQMAISLAFHMLFAAPGVGMPLLMLIAEGLWLGTGQPHYLTLAKTWAKATGIVFAIGAVSGTALAFELGLLWSRFMGVAGVATGPAFTLEAYAFFIEAIFIGLYLYGWDRLKPRIHWLTGIPIALGGMASSALVVAANAWMQNPVGLETLTRNAGAFNPAAALFSNPAWPVMAVHSTLSTYAATAFAVAGIYALHGLRDLRAATPTAPHQRLDRPTAAPTGGRRRDDASVGADVWRSGITIAMSVGLVAAVLLPLSGDLAARSAARLQPAKLAAMEAQFETERRAPLRIGGLPDPKSQTVPYAVEIPGLLSWLAFRDVNAEVQGLDQVPRADWPNVPLTHVAFQVMIVAGTAMLAVAAWFWWPAGRRRGAVFANRPLLLAVLSASPLGYVALQAGWVVTEIGRQPWIIYNAMRIEDGVTPSGGIVPAAVAFFVVYVLLLATVVWLLRRLRHEPTGAAGAVPNDRP